MAWIDGVVIRGGMFDGSTIGISSNIVTTRLDYITAYNNLNESAGETVQDATEIFYNTEFEKMLDVSALFKLDGAEFADECIADIAIMNGNTLVGYFSIYASRTNGAPAYVNVTGKIKNASGVVIGSFNGAGSIAIQTTVSGGGNPKCYLCLANTTHNNNTIYGLYFNFNQWWTGGAHTYGVKAYAGAFIDDDTISSTWNIDGTIDKDVKKKSPEFGPASEGGGGYNDTPSNPHGTFDNTSDKIDVPALPSVGVTSAGFINVYKIAQGELASLGEKLFPHFLPAEILNDPAQLTTPEVLSMFLKALYGTLISPVGTSVYLADNLGVLDVLMNGKLIDYILDCHILPVDINAPTTEGLRVGYRQFNDLPLAKATTDYVEVDCGSLSIGEYWGNFLDYSNCLCKIFLPFVGFVNVEPEMWNGGTIKIVYHINVVDGSFQAYIVSTSSKSELDETVVAQYGGVCCIHFPITGLQYSNVVAGLVNGSIGAVASGMSGNPAGIATNLANMSMLRPDAPMSNGYNASSSFLSVRKPYLLIERPWAQFSEKYPKEMGLPLNVTCLLSTVHGFTVVDNPVLNITCSDAEYQELCSLLKNGVIL